MIYLISNKTLVKIGKSKDPMKRLKQLQTGNGNALILIGTFDLPDSYERRLHGILRNLRTEGEWFDLQDKAHIDWLKNYVRELETTYQTSKLHK